MKYGLPYKGSKNKLAERIVRLLPRADHLIDLFCGGCAVTHAALIMGKYKHCHINDVNWMCPQLFTDALAGRYNDETRWISREDFERLKGTDPYVAVVWSFGNNLRDYLYSREIEPLKKAIHYAMFFHDYSLAKDLGHDLSFIEPITDLQKRYLAVKHYFEGKMNDRMQSFEGGQNQGLQLESYNRTQRLRQPQPPELGGGAKRLLNINTSAHQNFNTWKESTECRSSKKKKNRDGELCNGERRNCIAQIGSPRTKAAIASNFGGGQNSPLTSSVLDYAEVPIPEGSVIYCDIPYEDTNVYNKAEQFDYERFYRWAETQTQPVFISSYNMPRDRFDCIMEFEHRSTLSASANNLVTERIFVPKHQQERGNIAQEFTIDFPDE